MYDSGIDFDKINRAKLNRAIAKAMGHDSDDGTDDAPTCKPSKPSKSKRHDSGDDTDNAGSKFARLGL